MKAAESACMGNVFSESIEAIQFLHDETGRLYRTAGLDPRPGSQAAKELAATSSKHLLETAFSQGSMLIEVAADQAMAFTKTLSNPAQTIAPWTSARSLIESAALGTWLLDNSIDGHVRVKRSLAFRYEGLLQQEKFVKCEGLNDIADAVRKRIEKVEKNALSLGFLHIRDKHQKRIGIGMVMPSVTEIVDQALSKQGIYRLLSAAAHAHFWALNNLSFKPVLNNGIALTFKAASGVQVHPVQKGLHSMNIRGISAEVVSSLAKIVWTKFKIYGWDLQGIIGVLEITYDKIGVKKVDTRFWRKGNE